LLVRERHLEDTISLLAPLSEDPEIREKTIERFLHKMKAPPVKDLLLSAPYTILLALGRRMNKLLGIPTRVRQQVRLRQDIQDSNEIMSAHQYRLGELPLQNMETPDHQQRNSDPLR